MKNQEKLGASVKTLLAEPAPPAAERAVIAAAQTAFADKNQNRSVVLHQLKAKLSLLAAKQQLSAAGVAFLTDLTEHYPHLDSKSIGLAWLL